MLSLSVSGLPEPITAVVAAMGQRLDRLPARSNRKRVFDSTYQRSTEAVGEAIAAGRHWQERTSMPSG